MSKDKFITISKEMLRYILTLFFAAVGTYVGLQAHLNSLANRINNNEKSIKSIEYNIGNSNVCFMNEKLNIHGRYINRLVPNQISLAKDCDKKLLFHFEDLRGSK